MWLSGAAFSHTTWQVASSFKAPHFKLAAGIVALQRGDLA
jgi:hypothetical protein